MYKQRGKEHLVVTLSRKYSNTAVLYNYLFPKNPTANIRHEKQFVIPYLAVYLAEKTLGTRDEIVSFMYYSVHSFKMTCQVLAAQIQLDSNTNRKNAVLGGDFHLKGWHPFFPEFSFLKGTTEYTFQESKTLEKTILNDDIDKIRINPCMPYCRKATDNETSSIEELIYKGEKIDVKMVRQFLTDLNHCPDISNKPYSLIVPKRNHSVDCYNGNNGCNSIMVNLSKLSPHYENVRKILKCLRNMIFWHQFISDLDCALAWVTLCI